MYNEKPKCLNCKKELHRGQYKFCSNKCQTEYQYKKYIDSWKSGKSDGMKAQYQLSNHIRKYMLTKANYKCEKCGWGELNTYTLKYPLEIDHIDGNFRNNNESNLRVLCPNCHSLTKNYKGANLGNGRLSRKKYSEKYL